MQRPKVLFLHGLDDMQVALILSAAPKEFATTALSGKAPESEQIAQAREADFIMVYRARLSEDLVRSATRVRLIQLLAAGYDGMDMDLLKKLGIPCANNGGANSWAVADQTVLMMLSLYRRAVETDREVRAGRWTAGITGLNTFEMSNKVVGIFGLGNIGQKVAKRVQAFEAQVQYFNRHRLNPQSEKDLNVKYVELDELFRSSDILSLHAPLTADTHHLIDDARLRSMKPSAILINTSRGAIIDEDALTDALRSGRLAGAGLDAFTDEPVRPDNPLLTLDNVILSPHSAGTTSDTWIRRGRFGFENMGRVCSGELPASLVSDVKQRVFNS